MFRHVLETGEANVNAEVGGGPADEHGVVRHWLTSQYPVRGARGALIGIGVVVSEITERKLAEAEIRGMHESLERLVHERTAELEAAFQELDAFSYSVSHDLRAPLRAIGGFSGILVEEYGGVLPPEGRRYLDLVRAGAIRLSRLIDDLLAFARLNRQPLVKRTVDVGVLVRDVIDEVMGDAKERHVEVVLDALPAAAADPVLLRQVFVNLLSNALKYTRRRDPARIEIGAIAGPEGAGATYFVRDDGVGFDMRYAANLFGVFQRYHRAEEYEGTGVGLAIVQRIVVRHGGRVWAESAPDHGATFYFTLG
jgi:light-regulated signal transduction histidine kinase (bacteriophytochrome)